MNKQRLSGVLLHVTSLPSYGGVGDFGPAARVFVDFLAANLVPVVEREGPLAAS